MTAAVPSDSRASPPGVLRRPPAPGAGHESPHHPELPRQPRALAALRRNPVAAVRHPTGPGRSRPAAGPRVPSAPGARPAQQRRHPQRAPRRDPRVLPVLRHGVPPRGSCTVSASSPSRSSGPAAVPSSTSSTGRSRPSSAPWTAAPSTAAATTRSSPPCSTPARGSRKSSPCAPPTCAWTRPAQVRLHGKGRKERVCPLWPQTADLLRALLAERDRELQSDEPVFRNHRGMRLTRFGVRYLLRKLLRPRPSHGTGPARQTPPSPQHAAQHGRPPAPGGRRHRHDQPVARPRQRHDHAPVRHRRSRHEAGGSREGTPHRRRPRGAGPVAHGRVGAGMA